MKEEGSTAWWNMNVPEFLRTPVPPVFLSNIKPKDQEILSQRENEYHRLSWSEARKLIATNRIDLFQRTPVELRRYREYIHHIQQDYVSVADFVRQDRLQWPEDCLPAKVQVPGPTTRFNAPSQYKILSNDWPYGVEPRIVHLCVWTKFDLEDDPETGFLQPWVIKEIDDFVARVFIREEQQHRPDNSAQYLAGRRGIEELVLNEQAGTSDPAMHIDDRSPREHVIWFKNWVSLKSIAALEHFHVMLFDPLPAFVSRITNGDVPVSQRLGEQRISQACRSSASNHPSQSRATSDQLVTS